MAFPMLLLTLLDWLSDAYPKHDLVSPSVKRRLFFIPLKNCSESLG